MADYSDDFVRSDNLDISDGGAIPWVQIENEAGNARIVGNQLALESEAATGSGDVALIYYDDDFLEDQYSELEWQDGFEADFHGPAVRVDPGSTLTDATFYVVLVDSGGSPSLELRKYANEDILNTRSNELLTSKSLGASLANGTKVRLEAKKNGTSVDLRVLLDGVEEIAHTDSTSPITGGKAGGAAPKKQFINQVSFWGAWAGGDLSEAISAAESGMTLQDSARMVRYPVRQLQAQESLQLSESADAEDFAQKGLPVVVESFALSEQLAGGLGATDILFLDAFESLSLAEAAGAEVGPEFDPRALVIAEIQVDQGAEYVAAKGVRHPTRYYTARVKSWGSVIRSFRIPIGLTQIDDAIVEMIDTDGRLRKLFSEITPTNRKVVLKLGSEGESEKLFRRVFTGLISPDVTFPPGLCRMGLRSALFQFVDEEIPALLTRRNYDGSQFAKNLQQRVQGTFKEEEVFAPIPFGVLDSTGEDVRGVVNAVRLTDTRFNLSRLPVPHGALKLYKRGSGDDDFVIASGFQIVEEVREFDGVEYTLTHADFFSAPEDQFELRWDGEGITDDGTKDGAVITNPVDQIEAYLRRVCGKTDSELNGGSFAETAALVGAIETGGPVTGLQGAGAHVQRITKGDGLARMLTSFGLALYIDKAGLIAIRYISQDQENLVELDDVQDILERSETHAIGNPVVNVLNVQHSRMFSAGEWAQEFDQRDQDSVDQYRAEKKEDLPLWFVRDDFTAKKVAEDFLTWTHPQAHRVTFSAPGHRRAPVIELTRQVSLTSYSGPEPQGGGYVRRPFLVRKTSLDLDSKRLTVEAITRIQPVQTQGAVQGWMTLDARIGPHYQAAGNFFAVLRDRADVNRLIVPASTDWGEHFAEAEGISFGEKVMAHDSVVDRADSGMLLIVTQTEDGVVELHKFDKRERRWAYRNRVVWPSVSLFNNGGLQYMAQVERSRVRSRIGVFFHRESDPNLSGQSGGVRGRLAWSYSDNEGLTWSAPVDVGANISGQSPWGELFSYQGGRIHAGEGSQAEFHFFYHRQPGITVRSTEDSYHRTAVKSGALTGETNFHRSSLSHFSPLFAYGQIGEVASEAGLVLYVPVKFDAGGNYFAITSAPTMEKDDLVFVDIQDGTVLEGFAGRFGGKYPMLAIQADPFGGNLHYMGVSHRGLSSKQAWAWHHRVGSAADGFARVGPFYSDAQTPQAGGFLVLNLSGRLWMATLQAAATTAYDWYFTLWPLDIVPRDTAFDTDEIESLIDF